MVESKHKKRYWLYALKLHDEKYYIGITSRKDPMVRILEHYNGFYSAQWVKKYKPLKCVEKIELGLITEEAAFKQENKRTLQYMKKYGTNNVRGGKYNYSGKYVYIKFFGIFIPRENFWMLMAVSYMSLVLAYYAYKEIFIY